MSTTKELKVVISVRTLNVYNIIVVSEDKVEEGWGTQRLNTTIAFQSKGFVGYDYILYRLPTKTGMMPKLMYLKNIKL